MGRAPIGKIAMTGAERTRLYRRKHGTAKPVPKPSADNAAATIDVLKRCITEVEQERDTALAGCGGTRTNRLPDSAKPDSPQGPRDIGQRLWDRAQSRSDSSCG
jgi:hypothetical protein